MQRSADRLRVNTQLIDALTGKHVWAERYDREASDIFVVQDEVAQEIASRLGGYHGELAEAATAKPALVAQFLAFEIITTES